MAALRRLQSGVTLFELSLVCALLGILAAISIPAYRGYVERTNENRALTDLRSLSLRLARWELNHDGFPETLADAGLDGRLDPWGQPYVYLNIATADKNAVRKDKNLHPLNTDFDLYTIGEDGASSLPLTAQASRDDILRANNGSYFGRGENYTH
jgi:general secretion pathway protein G